MGTRGIKKGTKLGVWSEERKAKWMEKRWKKIEDKKTNVVEDMKAVEKDETNP